MLIQWQDAYSVGHAEIDGEHRQVVETINRLVAASGDAGAAAVEGGLAVLARYVEAHFAREEALLDRAGFPDLEAHKQEHAAFTREVARLRREFDAGNRAAINARLLSSLAQWWVRHICGTDKRCAGWLSQG